MPFKLPEPLREPPGALLGGLRESLIASLSFSMEDDDSNFIDVVDYLLSPDKDGCVSDRVIQKYLTLNPQAKEHLVEMLKQLATTNVEDHRFEDAIEPQADSCTHHTSEHTEARIDKDLKQRASRIGYVRVVGATPRALQLLQVSNRVVEGVSILSNVPRYNEDSDYDDLPIISNVYDEVLKAAEDFENNGGIQVTENEPAAGGCKKKRRKKRKNNNKKRSPDPEVELEIELEESEEADVYREMYRIDETLELFRKPLQLPAPSLKQQQLSVCERLGVSQQQHSRLNEKVQVQADSLNTIASYTAGLSSGIAAANALKSEALFDKEFKFKSVGQQDTKVATWDELKCLVSEVFPHDSELKKALDNKSQNSFELWKFVVKYGKMYKDFVSEVLEMVNELKKGLHEAMDMQREKTTEILESHKKEMCIVVEKARIAEGKIDLLEKELDRNKKLLDDQKVKIFGQDEELEKLRKEHITKDKKIKDFHNVKKSLIVEKSKAKDDVKKVTEEMRELKSELEKERKLNETLRAKVRRETDRVEDLEYKLRELENQHYDDQTEMENLQERNNVLTYKVDDLLKEISYLKEKLAKPESSVQRTKPVVATQAEIRQQLNRSPASEEVNSCSSSGIFTESSSSSSLGSKTSFSGTNSTVESPKGCSPVPNGAPRGHCTIFRNELHSLLDPETSNSALLAPDSRDDVFDNTNVADSRGNFSRTIRKGDNVQIQRGVNPQDHGTRADFSSPPFRPGHPQDDVNLSPGYNPWGPSSFAGFSSTSLLGRNDGCSSLFNILSSNSDGLPEGRTNLTSAPPGLEGINVSSGCSQSVGMASPLDIDFNNNLSNSCARQSVMDVPLNCGLTTNTAGNSSSTLSRTINGPTISRRLPVRRFLDFSDLDAPFYS
ncbi:uncharacterized protein LOC111255125 [Varroa destructor]|uniref:Uncharacterized protein n=1 Tax=Varroa destructor TaxID=109461 RepID=A0A7M7L7I1_VARDE|nr:uncharacterized protein LOC111255125 [Varroa destructor]XP_022672533.1 uncharacterized protein LOC111255125 [Varroa destructor]XP_022672538.1 uncharacterized protein LOC111255125 [Varroa destructor]XP_022672544.1 uncharacterized protein LOC111255125 [Varroa destructor]XP_022672550.1 uncharacterized protein LOC111255125 [Varroa destructor]XP_022672558.1 uncharacterized protein LOC111255125 [Varroa destructor]XP_022672563.1 uncharacterized protein LOC111255125 [Varroa destructor]XP_02267257